MPEPAGAAHSPAPSLFEGTDITAKGFDVNRHRQKVGMVFQQFNLFNNLTVLDNVTISHG